MERSTDITRITRSALSGGGVWLELPAAHPFNPLPLLRLALACSDDGCINRFVAGTVLRHVWLGGHDALDPARLEALQAALQSQLRPDASGQGAAAKALLRANTDEAMARGVFGVPSFLVGDRLFWGLDSLPMLRASLDGSDSWFDGPAWEASAQVPSGLPDQAAGPAAR